MIEDYINAKKAGDRQFRQDVNKNRDPYLPVLDDLLTTEIANNTEPVGNIEIPLSLVIGTKTKSRANSFASNFMPIADKNSEFAYKWSSLFEYQIESGITDPVKAYEYMGMFYIEEGNKRVSVMKYLGNPTIYASVTRILPKRTPETEVYYEFLDFYNVAPIYEIHFTRKGSYHKLARMMQMNMTDKWPSDLVRSLEGAYFRFSKVFYENGGQNLDFSAADAFLKYLSIYSFDSVLDISGAKLENRVHNIWNELLVESRPAESMVLNQDVEQKNYILNLLSRGPSYSEDKPLKIAFLLAGSPSVSGWDREHEAGRQYLQETMNGIVETWSYVDCDSEKEIVAAVEDAIEKGAKVVFATSAAHFNTIVRCAAEHKDVIFFDCVINTSSNLVRTYYGRLFEVKFLLGILAAQLCDNHKIAYLTDYPIYGTISNLNAFALGAAAIDPQIKVHVYWVNDDWRKEIKKENISIISGYDVEEPNSENREFGVFKLEDDKITNYGAPIWNWGKYYEKIVAPIANGTFDYNINNDQSLFLWWGLSHDVLNIKVSKDLSYYTRKTLSTYKDLLKKELISPFDGELRSQNMVIRKQKSGRLSDHKIIAMDWLNDNVVGEMPEYESLDEHGKALFEISGIIGEKQQ
ncbi:MAG: BMP family ABC transporter substrate-binding protein [Erysipelotrichaceae bacterium]|nr:BMP family ABC transporter substrate-binding protein [Erysipelotrichaceae bacterium]